MKTLTNHIDKFRLLKLVVGVGPIVFATITDVLKWNSSDRYLEGDTA